MAAIDRIDADQGVDHMGRTFGYDHDRKNFITWELVRGRIVVADVEHDAEETGCGSLAATMRDARRLAARENRKPNSQLRRSISQMD